MPTYEYECQKCGHRLEDFQSMTAKPLSKCPQCKGKLKRLIGAGAGLLFKGSGFYITDYRSSSYQDKKKGDNTSKSEGATKSDAPAVKSEPAASKPAPPAKSESKPAAKKKPE